MSTQVNDLSIGQLKRVIAIKEKIATLERELDSIQTPVTPAAPRPRKKKRTMSAAAKAAISASQKARWAERNKAKNGK
jgi:hypothetical protein